jgi:hypothetical protein
MVKGDYVLATKWSDGSAHDHWFVGYYNGELAYEHPRHDVVDDKGVSARGNGFRRVESITEDEGRYILDWKHDIHPINLWDLLNDKRDQESDNNG